MKKIIITILLAISVSFPLFIFAAGDTQKGADLYIEAIAAVSKKDFALAKAKFEEAAISLTGDNQTAALRMADFFGRMTSDISQKELSLSGEWTAVGEVKEQDRFWHLYQAPDYWGSILRLAMKGEKPLDEVVAAIGPDLFTKKLVIKNREGYISAPNTSIPELISRIRMWYCDKDDTTSIVYETSGYSKNATIPLDEIIKTNTTEFDLTFSNIECSYSLPISTRNIAIIIAVVLASILVWRFKIWQRVRLDWIKKIFSMEKPAGWAETKPAAVRPAAKPAIAKPAAGKRDFKGILRSILKVLVFTVCLNFGVGWTLGSMLLLFVMYPQPQYHNSSQLELFGILLAAGLAVLYLCFRLIRRKWVSRKQIIIAVVLMVLCQLVSLGFYNIYSTVSSVGSGVKGRDARRAADIMQIRTALELYRADLGHYPPNKEPVGVGGKCLSGNAFEEVCSSGDAVYIRQIPDEPLPRTDGACPDRAYIYQASADAKSYTIKYCLGVGAAGISAGEHLATPDKVAD